MVNNKASHRANVIHWVFIKATTLADRL